MHRYRQFRSVTQPFVPEVPLVLGVLVVHSMNFHLRPILTSHLFLRQVKD